MVRKGVFCCRYAIETGAIDGKRHFRLAKTVYRKVKYVVLKFYCEEEQFENALDVHSQLRKCNHVCR